MTHAFKKGDWVIEEIPLGYTEVNKGKEYPEYKTVSKKGATR